MSVYLQRAVLKTARTLTHVPQASFHTTAKVSTSSLSELIKEWHSDLKTGIDAKSLEIEVMTSKIKELALPTNSFDVERMEKTILKLDKIKETLKGDLKEILLESLENGKRALEERQLLSAILFFKRVISVSKEMEKEDEVKLWMAESYYHLALAIIATDEKSTPEKDQTILNCLRKAIEYNRDHNSAQTLLKTIELDPTSFRSATTRTLIHSRYSPNVTYY